MSERKSSTGLAERRRLRRRRVFIAFSILLLLLLAAAIWGLQQSPVRISHVQVFGPPSLGSFGGASADESIVAIATEAMQGSYFGIIPRDSFFFFFPSARIRAQVLSAHPEIAAVSIFRDGLTGLSIKIDNRIPIARWCGSSPDTTRLNLENSDLRFNLVASDCYFFDAKGFLYATTSQISPVNSFVLYEQLDDEPIGSTLPNTSLLPFVFDFARQLYTFGSPVVRIIIHDGEVDDYLQSDTRITYLLGDEQNAITALVSARENLNLTDGSLEYVDLRFSGKVYVKKK